MRMNLIRRVRRCSDQCVAVAVVSLLLAILLCSGGFLLYKVYVASNQSFYTEEVSTQNTNSGDFTVSLQNDLFETEGTFSDFKWVVFVDHPNFLELSAQYDHENGSRQAFTTNQNFINPFWMIPDHLNKNGNIYIEGRSIIGKFNLAVMEVEKFFALQSWLMIYMLFSIGIVFGTFILDIALALVLRERYLVYYALFLSVAQLYMYTSSGLSRISIGLSGYWFFIFGYATLSAALLFINGFLNMKAYTPRIATVNVTLATITGLGIGFLLMGLETGSGLVLGYKFILLMGLVVSFWALWALFYFKYKKYEISPYFLIGSVIQATTIPVLVVAESGLVAENMVYDLGYMFAASINGIFFTIGIVQQLKDVRVKNALFYQLATTDKLTGAYNRYSFDTEIEQRIESSERSGAALSLMILDIDHFKKVNDTHGHDVGDLVLKELVHLSRQVIRKSDKIYRWGGEEFAILMENTPLSMAEELANRLRLSVHGHRFEIVGQVTISAGVAQWQYGEEPKEWFKRIDLALYNAKNNGRNRVMVSIKELVESSNRVEREKSLCETEAEGQNQGAKVGNN